MFSSGRVFISITNEIKKDGRGKETLLTEKVMEELKLKEPSELIPWAYNEKDQTWQRIASLAPVCYSCAFQGDPVALDILQHSANKLSVLQDLFFTNVLNSLPFLQLLRDLTLIQTALFQLSYLGV